MEQKLYIIVYRGTPKSKWEERVGCVFEDRRLAENMLEIKRSQDTYGQYVIVEGPITSPETMAAAEARLGKF
jgi:hypothetical protein